MDKIVKREIIKTYAIQSKDIETRNKSTSGGTFTELAKKVLQSDGYVCAAGYDENGIVIHKIVNKVEHLIDLQGSKYVQSSLSSIFIQLQTLLLEGKLVLFVGTPCQVAGLQSFLGREYKNLCTIDLICFGVSSPRIYSLWRDEIETKERKKISKVYFRDKSYGYSAPNVKILFSDLSHIEQNKLVKSYMKTFMRRLNVRPSCYECAFKGNERFSDITLGDCWHIGCFNKVMDDNMGTTSVFVHSNKGLSMVESIRDNATIIEISTEKEIELDGIRMNTSIQKREDRSEFFKDIKNMTYVKVVEKWVPDSISEKGITFLKKTFKKSKLFRYILKISRQ